MSTETRSPCRAVLLLFALLMVPSWRTHGRLNIDDVEIVVPTDPVRLGSPVPVRVVDPRGRRLEVGLQAVEFALSNVGQRRTSLIEVVVERWQPVTAPDVALPTGPGEPAGFSGEEVALHWVVVVRDAGCRPKDQPLATRSVPIALVH